MTSSSQPSSGAMPSETAAHDPWRPALPPPSNMDHLVTEDDTPVDNLFSEKQQRLLTAPLFSSWKGPSAKISPQPSFVAMANVGLFYDSHQPAIVPDALLSLGVSLPEEIWPKPHRSYCVWEYGKAPEAAIEIVSNREGGEDTEKLVIYAKIGVRYYIVFDPWKQLSDETLRGFALGKHGYKPVNNLLWLPDIELGVRLWQGRFEDWEDTWLRWVDADNRLIATGDEKSDQERQRAQQQEKRAQQEKKRAQQEKNRAQQEKNRADKLAEQLRRLGVEPEDE